MQGVHAMLSVEHLLEEARDNGLPINKMRGILREYVQVIILNSVYKHALGRCMYFTGGTCLRYFYTMPRFSEDLDFDAVGLTYKGFKEILECVERGLIREGFSPGVSSEARGALYVAELSFRDLMRMYGITDKRGLDVMIKIEAYTPPWKTKSESGVISLYGYNFAAVLLEKGCMFSEKLCALLNRRRGRDIYDTLFMLKKKFPFNKDVLMAVKVQGNPGESILRHLRSLPEKEIKSLANQVKPFLFKEDDTDLILNASLYAEKFLNEYKE